MWDVIVVGGSVAGAASALSCARRGLKVLLLEKAPLGREKACGEGLLPAGVEALRRLGAFSALEEARGFPFYGVGFSFEGESVQADFPNGNAFGVRRQRFDQALFSLAAREPLVEARERTKVEGLLRAPSGRIIGVRLAGGEVARASLVVGADGLASRLRAEAGLDLGRPRRARYGIRAHFGPVRELPFGPYVRVILDPPGEFYLTPVAPDVVQVAFLGEHLRARGFSAKTFAKRVLTHPILGPLFAGAEAVSEARGAGPFGRRARQVVLDGFALVGDAAGYVDAVTGEGMELALRSAEALGPVAAGALNRGGPTREALLPYARARAAIVRDPERLTRLVLALERFPAVARRAIRALKKRPALFQKLLAVQGGEAPFSSVSLREILSLLLG